MLSKSHICDCTKSKKPKYHGNKTDTIVYPHVDLNFLSTPFYHRAGIDGVASDPAKCALCMARGSGRRNTGAGQCVHLADTNAIRPYPACMAATQRIHKSDPVSRR